MNNNYTTIEYNDFDPNKLFFTKFAKSNFFNDTHMNMKFGYPKYMNNKLNPFIQTPYFQLNDIGSGIPKLTEKNKIYFDTDKKREFIQVPLNQDISEQKDFTNIIRQIDSYYSSDEFKKENFGMKAKKYYYVPLIREIINKDDDDDDDDYNINNINNNNNKYPFIKFKFETDINTNQILTSLFSTINNNRTQITNLNNIDDFKFHIKYNSEVRIIFRFVMIWHNNSQYGIRIKASKIEILDNYNIDDMKQYINVDSFID